MPENFHKITAIDSSTGKLRWSYSLPHDVIPKMFSAESNTILVSFVDKQLGENVVHAFSADSGLEKWRLPARYCRYTPIFTEGRMFLPCPSEDQALLIDIETGKSSRSELYGKAFDTDDGIMFFSPTEKTGDGSRILFKLVLGDDKPRPVLLNGKTVVLPDGVYPYNSVAFYKGMILWTNENENTKVKKLHAFPYLPDKKGFSLAFDDGYVQETMYSELRHFWPGFSSFDVIRDPYLPLILTKKIDDHHVDTMLVVVDLDKGAYAWKSKVFRQPWGLFVQDDIFYHNGLYLIDFRYIEDKQSQESLLVLDAQTGHFRGALKLLGSYEDEQVRLEFNLSPMFWRGDRLYGFRLGHTWVMDLARLDLMGPGSNMFSLQPDTMTEKILGPLPLIQR